MPPTCVLSWSMFCVHYRIYIWLFLAGGSCICLLVPALLIPQLRFLLPYSFAILVIYQNRVLKSPKTIICGMYLFRFFSSSFINFVTPSFLHLVYICWLKKLSTLDLVNP